MYRLAYYRFDEMRTKQNGPTGWDTVRNVEIGFKGFKLHRFREAYSSERWIVRIYEVLPLPNMEKKMETKHSVGSGTTYPNRVKTVRPSSI